MTRIRFDFGSLTLDAELMETPTARAARGVAAVLGRAHVGRGGLFRRADHRRAGSWRARSDYSRRDRLLARGTGDRHRFWTHADFADETRLASPCNVFARALGDVKSLKAIKAGTRVQVTKLA
jgi:uncharacterized protein